jgi:integrase
VETSEPALGPDVVRGEVIGAMPDRKELVLVGRAALAELGVDPDELVDARTEEQLRRATPENTLDLLRWAFGFLIRYCGETGRRHDPPTVGTLRKMICDAFYMTDGQGRGRGRYGRPYAPNTIATVIYCLSMIFDRLQDRLDKPNPCRHPLVADQLKGYREDYAAAGHRTDESDALTPEESVALARAQDLGTVQGLRNAAMLRGQYDLACRADEWCKIRGEDLAWLDTDRVLVTFVRTKGRKPRTVPMQAVDGADADVDPVRLLARYVKARLSAGWDGTGPVWVHVSRGDRRKDYEETGVLGGRFRTDPMGYDAYADVFARAIRRTGIGLDPVTGKRVRHLTTHSNRIGPIDAWVRAGFRLEDIAPRTGHSPASPVIHKYLRHVPPWGDRNPGVAIRKASAAAQKKRPKVKRGGES